jgi:hypothetical protein
MRLTGSANVLRATRASLCFSFGGGAVVVAFWQMISKKFLQRE